MYEAKDERSLAIALFIKPLGQVQRQLMSVVFALVLLGASQSIFLLFLGPFLKALLSHAWQAPWVLGQELLPAGLITIFPKLARLRIASETLYLVVPAGLLLAGFLRSIALYYYQLHTTGITLFIAKNYRDRFFSTLLALPYQRIREKSAGEWMSLLMNDVLFLQSRFSDILNSFIRDGVVMVSAFITLAIMYWPMALLLACLSPFIALGMGKTGKRIAFFATAFQKELGYMADMVLEFRKRFEFIRSQGGELRELERFQSRNEAYYRMLKRSLWVRAAFAPGMELLGFCLFAAVLYLASHGRLGLAAISSTHLLIFFASLGMMLRPLRNIGEQLAKFHETRGSLRRGLEIFQSSLVGSQAALPLLKPQNTWSSLLKPEAELGQPLSLKALQLSYGQVGLAFAGTGMEISKGKTIAVIGPSGSGKSTLLKALAGLLAPLRWEANLSWPQVVSQTSLVSQEPFLFSDSLRANLLYGMALEAQPQEDGPLWEALGFVNMAGELARLPGGLDYEVRAVDRNLSGGQMQRLVIARAILRQKPILLCDEATAAVDAETERELTQRLISYCKENGRALVAVTHRLQWLSAFDEIWLVEGGKLVAQGAHGQLMQLERYREFCEATPAHS